MNTYQIDFAAKTITISAACADHMNDPESEEYKIIRRICADFPAMEIVRRTHATPRKYTSRSTGEVTRCNPFKNLTYENMERFISGLSNSEEYMTPYLFLKNCAALPQTSRYAAVRRWFTAQFPEFRRNPLFYFYNQVAVIDCMPFIEEAERHTDAEKKAS